MWFDVISKWRSSQISVACCLCFPPRWPSALSHLFLFRHQVTSNTAAQRPMNVKSPRGGGNPARPADSSSVWLWACWEKVSRERKLTLSADGVGSEHQLKSFPSAEVWKSWRWLCAVVETMASISDQRLLLASRLINGMYRSCVQTPVKPKTLDS